MSDNYYADKATARGIPAYMIPGLLRWIKQHIVPGSFLQAVLRNDLRAACENADDLNQNLLRNYIMFLYNDAPATCWGSVEKFDAWARQLQEAEAEGDQS